MKQKLGISLISVSYVLIGLSMLIIAVGIGFDGSEVGLPEEIVAVGSGAFGIIALVAFALAYGLYNLEAWGWYSVVVLNVICAMLAILQANICGLVIPALIIWYLLDNQRDFRVRVNL